MSIKRRQLLLEVLEPRVLFDAVPQATVDTPDEHFINESFDFAVTFDNTDPSDTGYGPYIDLHVPAELDFDPATATYLGEPLEDYETVGVFPAAPNNHLEHPYAKDSNGDPVQVFGNPGDTLYVFRVPFGSFVADQPPATLNFSATAQSSQGAQVGSPITIRATGGFQFGNDPLNNPQQDPSIIGADNQDSVTPTLFTLEKTPGSNDDEGTSSGPNLQLPFTLTLDVAEGMTITNVILQDALANNLEYVAHSLNPDGGTIEEEPQTPGPQNPPDNDIRINFGTITGVAGVDKTVTYEVFVPQFDTNGDPVIDPASGNDIFIPNTARVDAQFEGNPVAVSRDALLPGKSINVEKSVAVVNDIGSPGPTPGDTLEYTLDFHVSDFFEFDQVVIEDAFSDGQIFDPTFTPTFWFYEEGTQVNSTFELNNTYTLVRHDAVGEDGHTDLTFQVSDELVRQGQDGILTGDLYANAIQTDATGGRIVFRTVILEDYTNDFPSGDPSVDIGDVLSNQVDIHGRITASGQSEDDGDTAEVTIEGLTAEKTIYKINGQDPSGNPIRIVPGDQVTYSLKITMDSPDIENLTLEDYLPLPVYDATEIDGTFDNQHAIPDPGKYNFGPEHTLDEFTALQPTVTTDGDANKVSFQMGTFDFPYDPTKTYPVVVQILFTVTVTDEPFADALLLTNQLQTTYGTTFLHSLVHNALQQVELNEPAVFITKGVVSTDNPNGEFSPTTVGPVNFSAPGNAGAPFSGTINSDNLAAHPVDSNLADVDAGDLVKFAIILENRGRSHKGAFDVVVQDSLPANGFIIPTNATGLNLQVTDGAGNPINYTKPDDSPAAPEDLFNGGIKLVDSTTGALAQYDPNNGANIAVITYDLQLADDVQILAQRNNVGELSHYAGIEGGKDHLPNRTLINDATTDVTGPTITKALLGTSENSTADPDLTIGEEATYELLITLPEGETPDLRITDHIPDGMQYVAGSLSVDTSNFSGTLPAPNVSGGSSSGEDLVIDFGTITVDASTGTHDNTIRLTYRTVMLDQANNTAGVDRTNDAHVVVPSVPQAAANSNNVTVTVVEPHMVLQHNIVPDEADAGDRVTIEMTVQNTGNASSFDTIIEDQLGNLFVPGSMQAIDTPGNFTFHANGTTVTYDGGDPIAPNTTLTFRFSAVLATAVEANAVITNSARVIQATTLPGPDPNERNSPSAPDSDTLHIKTLAASKSVLGTNQAHTTGNNVAIGEQVQYQVVITLPEGTTPSLTLHDVLDAGLAMVQVDSITASPDLSFDDLPGGNPPQPGDAVISNAGAGAENQGRVLDINFGQVTNHNTDNNAAETITVTYTAVVINSAANNQGTALNNDADIAWQGAGADHLTRSANNVTVHESGLSMQKSVDHPSGDAGDIFTYTVRIDHSSGDEDVFNALLRDSLPAKMTLVAGSLQHTGGIAPTSLQEDGANNAIEVRYDSFADNGFSIIQFQGMLTVDAIPYEVITNTGHLSWTSLPGDQTTPQSQHNSLSVERTGDPNDPGGAVNDYRDSDDASLTVDPPEVSKWIVATSEANTPEPAAPTDPTSLDIGEIVRFRLTTSIPEGTAPGFKLHDTLPAGLQFLADDSTRISFVSDNAIDCAADLQGANNGAVPPTHILPANRISGADTGNLVFDLGDLVNHDSDADHEFIVLEFNALVTNIAANQSGTGLDSSYYAEVNNINTPDSNSVHLDLVEPNLQVAKAVSANTGDGGDVLTYTVTYTNLGTAQAFEILTSDSLPDDLVLDLNSINVVAPAGVTVTDNSAGNQVSILVDQLDYQAPDNTVSITYQAQIVNDVTAGREIDNQARVSYSSLPGTGTPANPTGSVTPGASGAADGERDGSGGVNDYAAVGQQRVYVDQPTIIKALVNQGQTEFTIGEEIGYVIRLTIPEGTTGGPHAYVRDILPAGLSYVPDSLAVNLPNGVSVGVNGNLDDSNPNFFNRQDPGADLAETITLEFVQLLNPAPNGVQQIEITYRARVDNIMLNQNGAERTNDAVLFTTDPNNDTQEVNFNPPTDPSITVVEPILNLAQTILTPTNDLDAGDAVQYRLYLEHDPQSRSGAFDVLLTDLIPAGVLITQVDSVTSTGMPAPSWEITGGGTGLRLANSTDDTFDMPLGATLEVIYTAVLQTAVVPHQTLTNQADVTWSTLDGNVAEERASGDGLLDQGGLNDYELQAAQSYQVKNISLTKSLRASAPDSQFTIGEIVPYQIRVNIPEGTSPDLVITDILGSGLQFVAGSVNVVNNNPRISFTNNPPVVTIDGQQMQVAFGDVTNTAGGGSDEDFVVIEFDAVVANQAVVQNNVTLANNASAQWTDQPAVSANTLNITATEPLLEVSKTPDNTTPNRGEEVTYTIDVQHITGNADPAANSQAAAHDIVVTDVLPDGVTFVSTNVPAGVTVDTTNLPTITFHIDTLTLADGNINFSYTVRVESDQLSGAELVNDVHMQWDTLAGNPGGVQVQRTGDPHDPGGTLNDLNDDTASTITVTGPDLAITNDDGLSNAQPGDRVTYTLTITNNGNSTAHGVSVKDVLPDEVVFVSASDGGSAVGQDVDWPLFDLDAGATVTRTVTVDVINPLPDGITSMTNHATVEDDGSQGADPTPADNQDDDTDVLVATPDLQVTNTNNENQLVPGQSYTYNITVTNVGGQDAVGVTLTDTLPDYTTFVSASAGGTFDPATRQVTWDIGDLAGDNGQVSRTVEVLVDSTLPAGVDQLTDTAQAVDDGSNGPDPTPDNNTATDTDPINAAPDLQVTKEDNLNSVQPGQVYTYTLSIRNNGTQDATGVTLTDTLPDQLEFLSASGNGSFDSNTRQVTWDIGSLATGEVLYRSVTVQVVASVAAGVTDFTNTATGADDGSNGPDPNPANNTATDVNNIDAQRDLTIVHSNQVDEMVPGEQYTYTLTISNVGNRDASGVDISDLLPDHVTFVSASDGGTENAGTVSWPTVDLAAGATITRTVTVQMDAVPAGVDTVSSTARVEDDPSNGPDPTPNNNIHIDTDTVKASPDLTITHTDPFDEVTPGQEYTYTLTIRNEGDQDASGVVITDMLPDEVTYVSSSNGGSAANGIVTWGPIDLAAGEEVTRTVTVRVNDPVPAGVDSLSSTVTVRDDGTNGADPTPDNNTHTHTDTLNAAPDLSITHTNNVDQMQPGREYTYVLTGQNQGPQDATGVVITDELPDYVTFVRASHGGTESGGTVTWDPVDLAVGSNVVRTVTVRVNDSVPSGVDTLTSTAQIADDGANGPDPTPANNTHTDSDTLAATPDLVVSKTNKADSITPGLVYTYLITIENVGDQDASGVTLTDTLPDHVEFITASDNGVLAGNQVSWNIGTLAAGQQVSQAVTVRVHDNLPAGVTTLTNTATAQDDNSNGNDPTPDNNTATDTDAVAPQVDLVVTNTNNTDTMVAGQQYTYTITVHNVGSQTATAATLNDELPDYVTFVAASHGGTLVGQTVQWDLGDLAPDAQVTRTVTVQVDDHLPAGVDTLSDKATAQDTSGLDPTPDNNTATDTDPLSAVPDLVIVHTNQVDQMEPGQEYEYTLTISNQGTQDATGVAIQDLLPAHTTFVSASDGGVATDGVVSWPHVDLAVGQTITRTVRVRVAATLPEGVGTLTSTAQVADDGANGLDPTPENNTHTDSDLVNAVPDLVVSQTNHTDEMLPGGTYTYHLNITNQGSQDASGVVLTDTLPAHVTVVSASAGFSQVGNQISWEVGDLAVGEQVTREITVQMDEQLPQGVDSLSNILTGVDDGSNGPDPTPANNTTTDTDNLPATPDLVVTNTDNLEELTPGQEYTYTLTVSNNGEQGASGVNLQDILPDYVTFVAASHGGTVNNGVVTWDLGDLDTGSTVTRTVTVRVDASLPAGVDQLTNTATAQDDGANGPDPTPANNAATDTDTLNAAPELEVTNTDNLDEVSPGQEYTYTLTVTNNGDQDASGVNLRDTLPDYVSFVAASNGGVFNNGVVQWDLGGLAVGASVDRTVTVRVNDEVPDGVSELVNTASVHDDGSNGPDPLLDNNTATDRDTLSSAAPDLVVTKSNDVDQMVPGQTYTYTITLDNVGNQNATGVVLQDVLPAYTTFVSATGDDWSVSNGVVRWEIGTVDYGAHLSRSVTVVVDSSVPGGVTNLTNQAQVSEDGSNGVDPTPGNNTATDSDDLAATPDLVVTNSSLPSELTPGQIYTYTMTVSNQGDQDASGVQLENQLPAYVTFISASHGGVAAGTNPEQVQWDIGDLAAGAELTRTVTVQVNSSVPSGVTSLTSTATVDDDGTNGPDPTPANNSADETDTLKATPDLTIVHSNNVDSMVPGQQYTYTLTITNTGNQTATGVAISDVLPNELSFVSASDGGQLNGNQVDWPTISLDPGATVTRTVTVQVNEPLAAGVDQVTSTAQVTDDGANGSDPTPDNNQHEDTDDIDAAPDLVVSKSNAVDDLVPGQQYTYTITLSNNGNQDARGVVLTDSLPNYTSFVEASQAGTFDGSSGIVTWNIGEVVSGMQLTRTVTVQVDDNIPAGVATLTNRAQARDDGANGPDANPADNEASDSDNVVGTPDLVVTQTNHTEQVQPGQSYTYTIQVENVGSQGASGVNLTDILPAHTTFVSASQGGVVNGNQVQWDLGDIAPGAVVTREVTVQVDASIPAGVDELSNSATAMDDGTNGTDPTPANNTATDTDTLEAAPDLSVSQTNHTDVLVAGQQYTYTLTVQNNGTQDATGVNLLDTLPPHTTFISATGNPVVNGNQVEWDLGNLAVGASQDVTVTVLVDPNLPPTVLSLSNTATVSDDGTNGTDLNLADNTATDTDAVNPQVDLVVSNTNNSTVLVPGQQYTYTLTLDNVGSQDASGVVLTDTLPEHLTFISASDGGVFDNTLRTIVWTVGDLGAGEQLQRTVTVQVDSPLPANVERLTNLATASDDGSHGVDPTPDNNIARDTDPVAATPDLTVTQSINTNEMVPGQEYTYTLTVNNQGTQDATGVVISDQLPDDVTFVSASHGGTVNNGTVSWDAIDLAVGDTVQRTITVRVNDTVPANLDELTNTAHVTDDGNNGPDPTPDNNTDEASTPLNAVPDLSITHTDNTDVVLPGHTYTYTLKAQNNGTQDATGVVISDQLPDDVTFVSASHGGTVNNGTVSWSAIDLAVGENVVRTVTVRVNDTVAAGVDTLTSTANIDDDHSNGADPTPANNTHEDTDTLNAVPDLSITHTNNTDEMVPGQNYTYHLDVQNQGAQGATGVVVTQQLPDEVTFVSATNGGILSGNTVTWSGLDLAAGASFQPTVTVQVNDPVTSGVDSVTSTVNVDDDHSNGADPTPDNNRHEDTDTLNATPDLQVSIENGVDVMAPGGQYTYTLTIENNGSQTAHGVSVKDLLPAYVSFVSASDSGSATHGMVSWPTFDLAPGATVTRTVTVQVDDTLPDGVDTLSSTAQVEDDGRNGPDPTPDNNTATDTDDVNAAPDLTISHTNHTDVLLPGQEYTYVLTVHNQGEQGASGAVISDQLPAGVTFVSASDGGTEAGGTVTWNAIDIDAGETVTRTVTVRVDDPVAAGLENVTSTAQVQDDGTNGPDPTPANNTHTDDDTLNAVPDLVVTHTNNVDTMALGQEYTYTLTVSNQGDQNASGVVITDLLPADVTFVSASDGGSVAGNTVTWPTIDLAAGATVTREVTVRVNNTISAGTDTLDSTAQVDDDHSGGADPTPENNSHVDSDPINAVPDLSVTHTDFSTQRTVGEEYTYTLTVRNEGEQGASGVVITDQLPDDVTFVSASDGGTESDGTVTWSAIDMAAGEEVTRTVTVRVNDTVAAGVDTLTSTARVTDDGANGTDANPNNNSHTDTDTLNAAADLSITHTNGTDTMVPGQEYTYTLTAENQGPQGATGMVITDQLPDYVTFVSASDGGTAVNGTVTWNPMAMDVGATVIHTVTVRVNDTVPAGVATLTSTAHITDDGSNGPDPDLTNNTHSDADTLNAVPDLSITHTNAVDEMVPGQEYTYTLRVRNEGEQDATGVAISDQLPDYVTFVGASHGGTEAGGQVSWSTIDLAAGASVERTVTVRVNDTVPAGVATLSSTAHVNDDGSNGPDANPANNDHTDTDTLNAAPDLVVTKTNLGDEMVPGQSYTYRITVRNTGNQNATAVTLTDYLSDYVSFVSATAGGTLVGDEVHWNLGDLDVGDAVTCEVTVFVDAAIPSGVDTLSNVAHAKQGGNDGLDPTPDDNVGVDTDTLHAAPDIVVTNDNHVTSMNPGAQYTYTLTIRNAGNQDATGVTLTDTLPSNVQLIDVSHGGTVNNGVVTWDIGDLAVNTTLTRTVTVQVVDPVPAGVETLTNTAHGADDNQNGPDPTPNNNTATDTDPVNAVPDLSVTHTNNVDEMVPGQEYTYTLTVRNTGNQDASGVVISDLLPDHVSFVSASDGGAANNGTVTWPTIYLGAGQTVQRTVTVRVHDTVPAGVDTLTSTAQVHDDGQSGPDPTPGNNRHEDTDDLLGAPDLVIVKTNNQGSTKVGSLTTYQLIVRNNGNQGATGVVIRDQLSEQMVFVSASHGGRLQGTNVIWPAVNLEAGQTIVRTLTVRVRAKGAELVNTATVADDGTNGDDPNPNNNRDMDVDRLVYPNPVTFQPDQVDIDQAWQEATEDWYQHEGAEPRYSMSLPLTPIYSGTVEPGAVMFIAVYDHNGSLQGNRTVVADAGGNWLATFPTTFFREEPYTINTRLSPANFVMATSFNLRTFFTPALLGGTAWSHYHNNLNDVFMNFSNERLETMRQAFLNPMSFDFYNYEFYTTGATPGGSS